MTQRVILLLLLMGTSDAQVSAPTVPPEKVPFCGGIVNGIVNPPCTTPPRVIYSPDPKYPRKHAKVNLPGTVQLATVVGPDGLPSDIAVSSSLSPEFDQAAIDAVKKWKFSPATKDGKLAATKIMLEITFPEKVLLRPRSGIAVVKSPFHSLTRQVGQNDFDKRGAL